MLAFTNGSQGELVTKLPLEWAFHRDAERVGWELGFHKTNLIDLLYWNTYKNEYDTDKRKDYPADQWEMIRTDLYAQAQGIRHPNRQSFIGDLWYRSEVEFSLEETQGEVHIRVPGLFNECWLYVNGEEAAHREHGKLWWHNDYRFEWDVDLTGTLKAGKNVLTLRCNCEHHLGGMFRRPFLYRETSP